MKVERTAARIFDLIEYGQTGPAEGALESALQKFGDQPCLRVAQALLLMRAGRVTQARLQAEQLSTLDIRDPQTVDALVRLLQQCCSWTALARTYERLLTTQDHRKITENLVQTYVRMGDYATAHRLSTELYRSYGEARYQVWMVQASLGQVPDDVSTHLQLTLAGRLLDAAVLSGKGLMTPSTVQTYILVLEQQGEYDTAVQFVCGVRGAKMGLPQARLETLARLLLRAGRRRVANAVARHWWHLQPDNWSAFECYLQSLEDDDAPATSTRDDAAGLVLELQSEQPEQRLSVTCNAADADYAAALRTTRALQAAQLSTGGRPIRGPYLAELTLLQRVARGSGAAADEAALDAAVAAYARRFYTAPCCFLDLSTFLTPASATAVRAWSLDDASDASAVADELARHTRRMLGLRCLVAMWGTRAAAQPTREAMRDLMEQCMDDYQAARPLSSALAWSEEGLCDGYISVALNIALHGFVAQQAEEREGGYDWLLHGLRLLQGVERLMNNPAWLMFAICFCGLLGLADVAAVHKLALKSIQHDTMSHLGYWPLRRGMLLDAMQTWNARAMEFYHRVEADCSLMRAKTFTYISWPALRDVRRYEYRLTHSLARAFTTAHGFVAELLRCQTQRNILDVCRGCGPEVWQTWRAVCACDGFEDNTDWLVVKSALLASVHDSKSQELVEAMTRAMPATSARLRLCRQLLHTLLLLHDVAVLTQHRQASRSQQQQQQQGKHGAKCKPRAKTADDTPSEENELPELYCETLRSAGDALCCLPAVQALASGGLLQFVLAHGEPCAEEAGDERGVQEQALRRHLTDAVLGQESDCSVAFEEFLYPEACLLSLLLRAGATRAKSGRMPLRAWALGLQDALSTAQQRYESGAWRVSKAVIEPNTYAYPLYMDKVKRVTQVMSDLVRDMDALCRMLA